MYNYVVIKNIWSKYKRILWIVFAIVFIAVLFLIKTGLFLKTKEIYQNANEETKLTYSNIALEDLVTKDTDGDKIMDWEESLWGTDPTKKETTPGVPDYETVSTLKAAQRDSTKATNEKEGEDITETDKFSRELFATIATLDQNGIMDATTIENLTTYLAEEITNSGQKKIFSLSDLKVIDDSSKLSIKRYSEKLGSIFDKNRMEKGVLDIIEKLSADEKNTRLLSELDPIIHKLNKIIAEVKKMEVPEPLALLHLDLLNNSEALVENISDIKFFDSDIIRTVSAITQYGERTAALQSAADRLTQKVGQQLSIGS